MRVCRAEDDSDSDSVDGESSDEDVWGLCEEPVMPKQLNRANSIVGDADSEQLMQKRQVIPTPCKL